MPWQETYARWRAADAFLSLGTPGRALGIRQVRLGYELAQRLAAVRMSRELENLATLAHVTLLPAGVHLDQHDHRLRTLTRREREILDLLCHGLTYIDVAAALVISEKTVSSHVSNLLRKTGTTNRIELTRLVVRVRTAESEEPTEPI
jgi:DNA-binding NarL/FixJ family response regulator